MSKKKVLVTGGSGFLGRRIVEEVKNLGHEIYAPRSIDMDLYDYNDTFKYLNCFKPDVVIHSAAYYGGIGINVAEPANLFRNNAIITTNIYEAASKAKVKKVVSVGSACAYPGDVAGDMSEDDFWSGELHHSVEAYGSSKKIQLIAQNAYYKQCGLEGNHVILTNLYGEDDVFTEYRSHVVSALIKRFSDKKNEGAKEIVNWGDGSPIREFLYVGDAAKILAESVNLPHDLNPINVGTGVGISIKELVDLVAETVGFNGELKWDTSKPNGVERKVLNISRMKKVFPKFDPLNLRYGLQKTVGWYLKNKEAADSRQ
jgi:GDP-L-fucose synthase